MHSQSSACARHFLMQHSLGVLAPQPLAIELGGQLMMAGEGQGVPERVKSIWMILVMVGKICSVLT